MARTNIHQSMFHEIAHCYH